MVSRKVDRAVGGLTGLLKLNLILSPVSFGSPVAGGVDKPLLRIVAAWRAKS